MPPRTRLLLPSVPLLLLVTGCGFAVDTPLGTADLPVAVAPVTIGPAQRGLRQDERVEAALPCAYDDEQLTCTTDTLAEGVHAVQVSDAAQPGELVQTAYVVVSSRPDYEPAVDSTPANPADGEMFDARLTGWGAEQELRVRVLLRGEVVQRRRLTTDAAGTAAVEVGRAGREAYEVRVRDGLWGAGGAPAFSVWLPA